MNNAKLEQFLAELRMLTLKHGLIVCSHYSDGCVVVDRPETIAGEYYYGYSGDNCWWIEWGNRKGPGDA